MQWYSSKTTSFVTDIKKELLLPTSFGLTTEIKFWTKRRGQIYSGMDIFL